MAEQERAKYTRPKERSVQHEYEAKDAVRDQETARRAQVAHEAGKTAVEHSDELLDEIDAVLEENAAEFIHQYVQQGGE